ncbi:alpha/beta fold hydrolase [bacterium]|nr:alpha/beta fold hydrolase [bacterium]
MIELSLKTKDDISIKINQYKTGHNEVVIICPGWFMTKDSNAFTKIAEELSKDFDIISMDFRGHGKSSGFYTFTSKETSDLQSVVDFAKQNYSKIYLAGFSLGGAQVLIHEALYHNVDKIIAVSAPSDFDKIENKVWRKEAFIPTFKKFEWKRWISIRPSLIIQTKIKPVDIVKQINVPVLFIAGKKDPTVCPWHTQKLYEKAVCPKKFELFENGIHAEDLYLSEPKRFINLCLEFLKG